jgi:hypothetical protein
VGCDQVLVDEERSMPIPVTCQCGGKFTAKDKAAGRIVPCPKCGRPVEIPSLFFARDDPFRIGVDPSDPPGSAYEPFPVAIDYSDPPDPPEVKAKRAYWKDPVVLIGTAVPTLVLLAFVAYLVNQRIESGFRERIAHLRAEADQLAADGRMVAAYEEYDALLEYAGDRDPGDNSTRAHIESAKRSKDKLWPTVKAERDRLEDARQAKIEEARLKKERDEENAREKEELSRLAQFTATVTGGAWVVKKDGHSEIIRGLNVSLIRAKIPRGELGQIIDVMLRYVLKRADRLDAQIKSLEASGQDASDCRKQGKLYVNLAATFFLMKDYDPDELVDVTKLYVLIRQAQTGDEAIISDAKKYDAITWDIFWPEAMTKFDARKAVTNIDGKFKIDGVRGGKYLLYAKHVTEYSLIEWLVSLEVGQSGEVSKDLFNEDAILILNKND